MGVLGSKSRSPRHPWIGHLLSCATGSRCVLIDAQKFTVAHLYYDTSDCNAALVALSGQSDLCHLIPGREARNAVSRKVPSLPHFTIPMTAHVLPPIKHSLSFPYSCAKAAEPCQPASGNRRVTVRYDVKLFRCQPVIALSDNTPLSCNAVPVLLDMTGQYAAMQEFCASVAPSHELADTQTPPTHASATPQEVIATPQHHISASHHVLPRKYIAVTYSSPNK